MLQKRFCELAERSFSQNIYTYTSFLSLPEQDLFHRMESELQYAGVTLYGGAQGCDRRMLRFGSSSRMGFEEEFPIRCIAAEPRQEKYSQELTHRDYLGALMNLGISRELLGDIFVKEKVGYFFCTERIAPFLVEELTRIRHTAVSCRILQEWADCLKKEVSIRKVGVAGERLDSILAKAYNLSRSQSQMLFSAGNIYVNGRLCENTGYRPKNMEEISVRGYGKFRYRGAEGLTKKGKLSVILEIYG